MPETSNTNSKNSNHNTDKLKIQIIAGFAVIIPVMIVFIILFFNIRMSKALKQQTAEMIENVNLQIKTSTYNYLDTIAGNAGMILSDEAIIAFDPATGTEAEREEINNKLLSYALYSDYKDYGIVYSDGTYVGKMSHELLDTCGDKLYSTLDKAMIKSGNWTSEIVPERASTMYLARLGDSAIEVASVPSEDLTVKLKETFFIDGMNTYISDKSLIVISTTDDEVVPGSYLRTDLSRLVDRVNQTTQIGDSYVVATQKLDNGWYVVSCVPSDDILNSLKTTNKHVILVSVIMSLLAIGYVFYLTQRIIISINQTVDRLDVKAQTDLLTGLINKRSFEDIVEMTLNKADPNFAYAMIFMDIDNFKGVNDRCGHDVGDLVLKSFSHSIDTVFRETDVKGRLGGDEFCVLMKMTKEDKEVLVTHINEVCHRFTEALHRKANSARQSLPAVTSSIGAALWEGAPEGFDELYHKADTALYASKKRGKDTWTIYGQEVKDENTDQLA